MERFLLVFGLAIFLTGTGLRAETIVDAQSAIPALVSPTFLPFTFFALLMALCGYLYAHARRS